MDTITFIISKILWLLISPDALLLLLALMGLLFLFLNKLKLAKIFLAFTILSFSFIAFLPLDEWLAYPLENRFSAKPDLPANIDGIIVLGGAIDALASSLWQQVEMGSAGERNSAFVTLAKRYPEAKLVFTGGQGLLAHQDLKGADFAQIFFTQLGLPSERVIFERESRNTYENVINSQKLIPSTANETWILITSATHMPRAVGLFCQQNWSVIPYPVDHGTSPGRLVRVEFNFADNLSFLKISLHEWLGLFAHRISGKTASLLPASCY